MLENFLKSELNKLAKEFSIIGDVRGQGLFIGIELVDHQLNPLAEQTTYLANRMKDHGILMSIDGPDYNIFKNKTSNYILKKECKRISLLFKESIGKKIL